MADGGANSGSARGSWRSLVDSLVSLMIAVLLFRSFATEGYMISTGSMAPALLGFHKRVVCPTCRFPFAFGVAYDEASDVQNVGDAVHATCPNCGQGGIDLRKVPRNYGDQLLVHKHAFDWHSPRRWDVVVFRNPMRPSEAFVKRVVGLPGERIQLIDGDVFVDGQIVRKDLATQREMRITVFDHTFRPKDDPTWQERWVPEATSPTLNAQRSTRSSRWRAVGDGFEFREHEGETRSLPLAWVNYRHWIRSRGLHETSVALDRIPAGVEPKWLQVGSVRYHAESRQLSCVGVLSPERRNQLLALSDDPQFQQAIRRLEAESHVSPICDTYGYNLTDGGVPPVPVRDLMFSARVRCSPGEGQFVVEMTDGSQLFDCVFDFRTGVVALLVDRGPESVLSAPLPEAMRRDAVTVEMSLCDRQVLIAVDGERILPAWEFSRDEGTTRTSRQPVRFGARGIHVRVDQLQLFRDVHYTWAKGRNGVNRPFVLGPDEYFMLGDNSPVSYDSRRWEAGGVPERLLLGKPFLVHLPSRPGKIRIGSSAVYIRIPDVERMRYIR